MSKDFAFVVYLKDPVSRFSKSDNIKYVKVMILFQNHSFAQYLQIII